MTLAFQSDATTTGLAGLSVQTANGDAALADLASVTIEDADAFLAAEEQAQVKASVYFFPHLVFTGASKSRGLHWERHGDSILLYQINRLKGETEMKLYCPPFPFDAAALRHAKQRMRDFNEGREGRIIFVQEREALQVAREGFTISLRSEEFILDRAAVVALEGSAFAKVRSELSRSLRQGQVETRPYTPEDRGICLALAKAWQERLIASGMKVASSYGVTTACLKEAHRFPSSLLAGLVVEVDGEVRGFAFSGSLNSVMGCNYVCVTDLGVPGLTLLLRHRLMAAFPGLAHFNDADDAKRPEIRATKMRLNPIEMYGVFKAIER